jgi:DNA repair protein RecO (recombination protein O)
MQPSELNQLKLNHEFRRNLILAYQQFYALHVEDFGTMKTLPVLQSLLS